MAMIGHCSCEVEDVPHSELWKVSKQISRWFLCVMTDVVRQNSTDENATQFEWIVCCNSLCTGCSANQNGQQLKPAARYLLSTERFTTSYVLRYSPESQDAQRFKLMACYPAAASWVELPWMAMIHHCSCSKHDGEHVPHCKLRNQLPELPSREIERRREGER